MKKTNYDKYTIGKNPAAIYLIELLSQDEYSKHSSVLTRISKFRDIFKSLEKSCEDKKVEKKVLLAFCEMKRILLLDEVKQLIADGMDEIIANLYVNILISDMRKVERVYRKISRIEHNAITRAKSIYRDKKMVGLVTMETYGTVDSTSADRYPIVVVIDNNVVLKSTTLSPSEIIEYVSDDTKIAQSKAKLANKNRPCTYY